LRNPFSKTNRIILILLFSALFIIGKVNAGFGISPASINNNNVIPGTQLEYEINVSLPQTDNESTVIIKRELGEINDWIKILPSENIKVERGSSLKKVQLIISVPSNASFREYLGALQIYVQTGVTTQNGNVVQTAVKYDIRLTLSNTETSGFVIRAVNMPAVKVGSDIKVVSKIENIGNVDGTISSIDLEIRDINQNLIDTLSNNSIGIIPAGQIIDITSRYPNSLGVGDYFVTVKAIYDGQVLIKDKQLLKVLPLVQEESSFFSLSGLKNALNMQNISDIGLMSIIVIMLLTIFMCVVFLYVKNPGNKAFIIGPLIWIFGIALLGSIALLIYFGVKETNKISDNGLVNENAVQNITTDNNEGEVRGLATQSNVIEKNTLPYISVYDEPNTNSIVIYSTKPNDKAIIKSERATWYEVEINGISGFIAKDDIIN
jgi:hypothetical protein